MIYVFKIKLRVEADLIVIKRKINKEKRKKAIKIIRTIIKMRKFNMTNKVVVKVKVFIKIKAT
jgi:hypothetical protein